jgi:Domain of unknown function (DUF4149)
MNTLVRFLQFLSLGTWVGAILFFSAIMAPAAFSLFTTQQAGSLVSITLGRLHLAGMVCGVIYLFITAVGARSATALLRPASLLVLAMIVLTFLSQFWVTGNMEALRAQAGGPLEALPAGSALRASFDRLHLLSVRLEVGVLIAGLLALLLTSRVSAPRTGASPADPVATQSAP